MKVLWIRFYPPAQEKNAVRDFEFVTENHRKQLSSVLLAHNNWQNLRK